MRIAVFASGNGSNFAALQEAILAGSLQAEIVLLFTDQPHAFVRQRAEAFDIPCVHFRLQDFPNKVAYETRLKELLLEVAVDYVVLAGYMKIIGPTLLQAFPERIVNIHPSLLPSFPGLAAIEQAYEADVAQTGVTVHYVDAGVDTGKIIAQRTVAIAPTDDLATLTQKVQQIEHQLYPQIMQQLAGKELLQNEKTRIN